MAGAWVGGSTASSMRFAGGATAQITTRAHAGVLVDLIGPLALVVAADLYAECDGGGPFGFAVEASAGIRVRMLARSSSD